MNIKHALSLRSDFSLGESMLQIKPMIEKAKALGYESVAIVDNMTISSMVEFTNQAKKAGLKPIIGCTLRVYDDPTYRKSKENDGPKQSREVRVKAYVQTEEGLRNLIAVLSRAYTEERFYYNARCGFEDLKALKGCALTTGDFQNLFHHPDAVNLLHDLWAATGEAIYVELTPIATPLWDTLNEKAMRAAVSLNLPVIIGHPSLYVEPDDAASLDVLRAIRENGQVSERWVPRHFVRDFHMKPPLELVKAAIDLNARVPFRVKHALKCIDDLAQSVSYEFTKLPPCLPKMASDEWGALRALCLAGFKERLTKPVLNYQPAAADLPKYVERLRYELDVLKNMGFSGYFLLVHYIVEWAKNNGIIVGPGRGSVGGSLVAYLIGITDVDPIRFDLLFERFINPERLDLPDADLDFMTTRRHEVIEQIISQFGADNVAGISNFTSLQAAGALRDVSRIHGLQPYEYACSKLMEREHGKTLSLEESAALVPEIEKFKDAHPHLWRHATKLEGCMRGLGQHAAGVVIADRPVSERAVVETRAKGRVVNWDKKYVEDWGLIKIDVLGLSTLDMLALGKEYVQARHAVTIDYMDVDLADAAVLARFAAGDTTGVFQFEGSGMRKLLKELALGGTLTFEDLVATVSLFRPGPLDAGLCDEYVQIKQGTRTPYYPHPNMEPALRATFGVIVYQEQVMQICRDLAGFTMAEADHVRKAMGKKDLDKMKEQKEAFVAGALKVSGLDTGRAEAIWDTIEGFAGYGFNRSHAVEYALISFWTMWLKHYYPAEFYAAALSIQDDDDRLAPLVIDAKERGVQVLPPDINRSSTKIEIGIKGELYAPFQAVKGISGNVAEAIVELRNNGGRTEFDSTGVVKEVRFEGWFKTKADLDPEWQKRMFPRVRINRAHIERLEKVGAFWSLDTVGPQPLHTDRLKDRLELMPGYTVEAVKATRAIPTDRIILLKLLDHARTLQSCEACTLKGKPHVLPQPGKTPKFVAVFDAPSFKEEKAGKMFVGDSAAVLKAALTDAGLTPNDGYYTALVKAAKQGKGLTNDQINGCAPNLEKELEILKPPVILILGSNALRYFAPTLKGSMMDYAGKTIYDPKRDATLVVGINPSQVLFDASKAAPLTAACEQVASLVKT